MTASDPRFPYPRRRVLRFFIRQLSKVALAALAKVEVYGLENVPENESLIIAPNHFHWADPALIIRAFPYPLDFLGGFQFIDPPQIVKFLPRIYGYYPVRRGAVSGLAMRAAKAVLAQNGLLCVFPEAGSWATVLRPARPGVPFLAATTQARVLPVGLTGMPDIFARFNGRSRPTIQVRIGQPIGPFETHAIGRQRRAELEEIGETIMRQLATLLPPEQHGVYSADPELRAAAQAVADYPYHDLNAE